MAVIPKLILLTSSFLWPELPDLGMTRLKLASLYQERLNKLMQYIIIDDQLPVAAEAAVTVTELSGVEI